MSKEKIDFWKMYALTDDNNNPVLFRTDYGKYARFHPDKKITLAEKLLREDKDTIEEYIIINKKDFEEI